MAIRTTWRKSEPQAVQIVGAEKDRFIRGAVGEIPDLSEEALARIAQHLCGLVDAVTASRATIERYKAPPFDPNAFSAMKVYRTSGEKGLRQKLIEIVGREETPRGLAGRFLAHHSLHGRFGGLPLGFGRSLLLQLLPLTTPLAF
jgi:hypothetical protein